jgi:cytochrome c553
MRALAVLIVTAACGGSASTEAPPPWAFPVPSPGAAPAVDDGTVHHVPGSAAGFTGTQLRDLFAAVDWHPDGHPPMPAIVAHGRPPAVDACGYCHLPSGLGRPENASLAGLPAGYIAEQVAAFKRGTRRGSQPGRLPVQLMIAVARAATEAEVAAAASYFAALPRRPWIRVVEAERAPTTHVAGWMLVPSEPAATEPLGQRILELPEDVVRTELRDDASGFVAYVPVGSLRRGEALVRLGAGKTLPCGTCHGPELHGLGRVPAITGRSPSYTVRQLYDFAHDGRTGGPAEQMKPVVARLTEEDLIAIAAYTASLAP